MSILSYRGNDPNSFAGSLLCSKGKLTLYPGFVNDLAASVFRDTGATIVGVKKEFINLRQLTGKSLSRMTFGGTVETYPVAIIEVQTPFISGWLEACVLDDASADLIIGNVPGVKHLSVS